MATEFQPLFDALTKNRVAVDITQRRHFLKVLGHESEWSWDRVEKIAIAIFASDDETATAVQQAIEDIRLGSDRGKKLREEIDKKIASKTKGSSVDTERQVTRWLRILIGALIVSTTYVVVKKDIEILPDGTTILKTYFEASAAPQVQQTPLPKDDNCNPFRPRNTCQDRVNNQRVSAGGFFTILPFLSTFAALSLVYCLRCPLQRRYSKDPWRAYSGRFFVGEVGPNRESVVSPASLDEIAATLTRPDPGGRLDNVDMQRTVDSSARNAGIPSIVSPPFRVSRRLLILDDVTDPLEPVLRIAEHLADGMKRRGVSAWIAAIEGTLDTVRDGMGREIPMLQAVADPDQVVVIVGRESIWRGLPRKTAAAILTSKSAVWIDPDMRANERASRVMQGGLVRCNAVDKEIVAAFDAVCGKIAMGVHDDKPTTFADTNPVTWLGEALPFAILGAIAQPMSLDLADHIRRRFLPWLGPLALRRIAGCPGVRVIGETFEYTPGLHKLMINEFALRFTRDQRDKIVNEVLNVVRLAEPEERGTLAHGSWQAYFYRIQMFIDPAKAMAGLEQLIPTSIGGGIRRHLRRLESDTDFNSALPIIAPSLDMGSYRLMAQGAKIGPLSLSIGVWTLMISAWSILFIATVWLSYNAGV